MPKDTRSVNSGLMALLSPEELAEYLGVPLATIYRWRSLGGGPAGIRVGKHVRYRIDDVEGWLLGQRDEPVGPPVAARRRSRRTA